MPNVITYKAPAGFAGGITRVDDTTVEPVFFAAAAYPTAFGQPVKLSGGKAVLMGAGSVAADFYGILAREVPSMGSATAEAFADGTPNPASAHGLVTRGYVLAPCVVGTPVRGGTVYVRIVDGGAGKPVGQFEATADGVNNVALVGVTWAADGKEATTNIAEIRVAR
jgi:hypothetical protein